MTVISRSTAWLAFVWFVLNPVHKEVCCSTKYCIDYKHNVVFEEGAETALYIVNPPSVLGRATDNVSSTITIPATATNGNTRNADQHGTE